MSGTDTELKKQPIRETKQKERVQLDFTPEALQRLEDIQHMVGATTRAEVIRNAIRLYAWFISETKPTSTISITDEKGNPTSVFKASLLHDAMVQK
ncbi:hypothetical protein [Ktedonobacter racemifer]|uniref:Ribbon-helix-helix protein CopG domain-containing protein n=1 Tax=Ktedonobacter racemifer DSM 44963 TaxID=485913 RepID=D6TH18_KTERA|nr:hypothetical protein [Ktedonobacter racemifer]EFH88947.1 hypothetical protein Krac_10463 [Ktedonobacter racemifer DSM 44963]